MKFAKLFALSLLALLFESALVLGGYVESGQCEVIYNYSKISPISLKLYSYGQPRDVSLTVIVVSLKLYNFLVVVILIV